MKSINLRVIEQKNSPLPDAKAAFPLLFSRDLEATFAYGTNPTSLRFLELRRKGAARTRL